MHPDRVSVYEASSYHGEGEASRPAYQSPMPPTAPLDAPPLPLHHTLPQAALAPPPAAVDSAARGGGQPAAPLVLSVSITVIEPCIEAPLPGLDPVTAPFSGRRLWRIPVVRIYGVVNENPGVSLSRAAAARLFPPASERLASTPSAHVGISPAGAAVQAASGACPAGDKRLLGRMCCVAVHNVFPYFFVPVPRDAQDRPEAWLQWFGAKLRDCEEKLTARRGRDDAASSRHETARRWGGGPPPRPVPTAASPSAAASPGAPLVFSLRLVRKRAFYGYDPAPRFFVQIFTLQPGPKSVQLAALLLHGRVTGRPLQPFEIHIPFVSHFLADHCLRGMDRLTVAAPRFVRPLLLSPALLLPRHVRPAPGLGAVPNCAAFARVRQTESLSVTDPTGDTLRPAASMTVVPARPDQLAGALQRGKDACPGGGADPRDGTQGTGARGQRAHEPVDSGPGEACGGHEDTGNAAKSEGGTSAAGRLRVTTSPWGPRVCSTACSDLTLHRFSEAVPGSVFLNSAWARLWSRVRDSAVLKAVEDAPRTEEADLLSRSAAKASLLRASPMRVSAASHSASPAAPLSSGSAQPTAAPSPAADPPDTLLSRDSPGFHLLHARILRRTKCELECHVSSRDILNPFFVSELDLGDAPSLAPSAASCAPPPAPKSESAEPAGRQLTAEFAAGVLLPSVLDFWSEEARRCARLGIPFPFHDPHAGLPSPSTLPPAAAAALAQRDETPAREAVPEIFKRRLAQLLVRTGALRDVALLEAQLRGKTDPDAESAAKPGEHEEAVSGREAAASSRLEVPGRPARSQSLSGSPHCEGEDSQSPSHARFRGETQDESERRTRSADGATRGPAVPHAAEDVARAQQVSTTFCEDSGGRQDEATGDGASPSRLRDRLHETCEKHSTKRLCVTSSQPQGEAGGANAAGTAASTADARYALEVPSPSSSLRLSLHEGMQAARHRRLSQSSATSPFAPSSTDESELPFDAFASPAGSQHFSLSGSQGVSAAAALDAFRSISSANAPADFGGVSEASARWRPLSPSLGAAAETPVEMEPTTAAVAAEGTLESFEAGADRRVWPPVCPGEARGPESCGVRPSDSRETASPSHVQSREDRASLSGGEDSRALPLTCAAPPRRSSAEAPRAVRACRSGCGEGRTLPRGLPARVSAGDADMRETEDATAGACLRRRARPVEPSSAQHAHTAATRKPVSARIRDTETDARRPEDVLKGGDSAHTEGDSRRGETTRWSEARVEDARSDARKRGQEAEGLGVSSASREEALDAGAFSDSAYDAVLSSNEAEEGSRGLRRGGRGEGSELFAGGSSSRSQSSVSDVSSAEEEARRARRSQRQRKRFGRREETAGVDSGASSSCSPTAGYDASAGSSDEASPPSEPGEVSEAGRELAQTRACKERREDRRQQPIFPPPRPTVEERGAGTEASSGSRAEGSKGVPLAGSREALSNGDDGDPRRPDRGLDGRLRFASLHPVESHSPYAERVTAPSFRRLSRPSRANMAGVRASAGNRDDASEPQPLTEGLVESRNASCGGAKPRSETPLLSGAGLAEQGRGEEGSSSSSYAATVVLTSASEDACRGDERPDPEDEGRPERYDPAAEKGARSETVSPGGRGPSQGEGPKQTPGGLGRSKAPPETIDGAKHSFREELSPRRRESQATAGSAKRPSHPSQLSLAPSVHDSVSSQHRSVSQSWVAGWPDTPAKQPFFGDPHDAPAAFLRAPHAPGDIRQFRPRDGAATGAQRASSVAAAAQEARLLAERRTALGLKTRRRRGKKRVRQSQAITLSSQQTSSQASQCTSREASQLTSSQASDRRPLLSGEGGLEVPRSHRADPRNDSGSSHRVGWRVEAEGEMSGASGARVSQSSLGGAGEHETSVMEIVSSASEGDEDSARGRLLNAPRASWSPVEAAGETNEAVWPDVRGVRDAGRDPGFCGELSPSEGLALPPIDRLLGFHRAPPALEEALASSAPHAQDRHRRLVERTARREARRRRREACENQRRKERAERRSDGSRNHGRRGARGGASRERAACSQSRRPAFKWATRMDNVGRIVQMLVPETQPAESGEGESVRGRRRGGRKDHSQSRTPVRGNSDRPGGPPGVQESSTPQSAPVGPQNLSRLAGASGSAGRQEPCKDSGREASVSGSSAVLLSPCAPLHPSLSPAAGSLVSAGSVFPSHRSPLATPDAAAVAWEAALALAGPAVQGRRAGDFREASASCPGEGGDRCGQERRRMLYEDGDARPRLDGQSASSSQSLAWLSSCLSAESVPTSHSFSSGVCASSHESPSTAGGAGRACGAAEGSRSQLSVAGEVKEAMKHARPFQAASKPGGDRAVDEDSVIRGEQRLASYGALAVLEVLAERSECSPEVVDAGSPDPQQDAILAVALLLRDERLSLACRRAQREDARRREERAARATGWTESAEKGETAGDWKGAGEAQPPQHVTQAKESEEGLNSSGDEGASVDTVANAASDADEDKRSCKRKLYLAAGSRAEKGEGHQTPGQDALAYFDAAIIIFVDKPYKPRLPLASPSPSPVTPAFPPGRSASTGPLVESPLFSAPDGFAGFAALWQARHPFLKPASQQLGAFLSPETELVAAESEVALLRQLCLLCTVADPALIMQWDSGNTGLRFLLRRAHVLGCGADVARGLGRRTDSVLLSSLQSYLGAASTASASPASGTSSSAAAPSGTAAVRARGAPYPAGGHPGGPSPVQADGSSSGRGGRGVTQVLFEGGTLSGRLLLECWRLLQREVKLQQSSLEGVTREVLGVTFASVPPAVLANLWKQGQSVLRRAERRDEVDLLTAWRAWQHAVRSFRERKRARPARDAAKTRQEVDRAGGCETASSAPREQGGTSGRRSDGEAPEEGEGESQPPEEGRDGVADEAEEAAVMQRLFLEVESSIGRPAGSLADAKQQERDREALWAISTMGAVLKYFLGRARMTLALLDSTELIPRTSELARLYGCDFFSALTRGSQFKVESVVLQATKRLDYLFVSPSQTQVTEQPANLCIPLVLEPKSGFYWSPVLVLDFRSLYPSIIIANNICYSTALGSVEVDPTAQPVKRLGVLNVCTPPSLFQQVSEAYYSAWAREFGVDPRALFDSQREGGEVAKPEGCGGSRKSQASNIFCRSQAWDAEKAGVHLLPSGGMFVSRRVRKGIFPQVLTDILQTRIMIQKAIKVYKGKVDDGLLRLLNYRQYGLKMIANVTYGYTAASFSGHMPCADIADAIVQTARTTLMRAIELVHRTPRWGGRVLYGDTDSLFVLVENKSLEAAFEIGREIAYAVTQQNPAPVELELEKVFYPCCLVSKKRYVGNAYAAPNLPPTFDAKVKAHLYRQWTKILANQVPLKEFIFYRKCRLGSYRAEFGASTAASLPPQAKVAYARLQALARATADRAGASAAGEDAGSGSRASGDGPRLQAGPSHGERVAFVYADLGLGGGEAFLRGKQSALRLLDCAVSPEQVEGGGRPDNLVRLFLYGAPQLMLRPMPLQRPESGAGDPEARAAEGDGTEAWQPAASLGWFRRWGNVPGLGAAKSEDVVLPPWWYRQRQASPAAPGQAAPFGGPRADMSSMVALFARASPSSAPPPQAPDLDAPGPCLAQVPVEGPAPLLLPVYAKYYIVRQVIPALDRLFSLLAGATAVDLRQWFDTMPKPQTSRATRIRRQMQPGPQTVKPLGQAMLKLGTGAVPGRLSNPVTHRVLGRHGPPTDRTTLALQRPPAAARGASAAQRQQKLLRALKADKPGAGSGVRLHHFFAASSCVFCEAKCPLLRPGSTGELLQRGRETVAGRDAGRPGDRDSWRRRHNSPIAFEEEDMVRARLFKIFECSGFSSDEDEDRQDDGKVVIDVSSASGPLLASGSVFRPLFEAPSPREWQPPPVCADCSRDAERLLVEAHLELREAERGLKEIEDLCEACAGKDDLGTICSASGRTPSWGASRCPVAQ
ncbi:hypothetical protein BESB_048020 [Besnoitia besnoiti]|uniref:DNA-directed DNA polymerase n=1 Tax=Besnoitia besnoiti TaxID=94643 RepID=A0A2A9MM52_BESBE|nr:hypothetical protein BESB_048020 [Besnoitia besnoiti]PFH36610.1 hypothetical protein BESB_048020 [Besnoitia besnoiti]